MALFSNRFTCYRLGDRGLIPASIHVMPVIGNDEQIKGFRACVASVPGCVIRLQDPNKAAEIMSATVKVLIEEENEHSVFN